MWVEWRVPIGWIFFDVPLFTFWYVTKDVSFLSYLAKSASVRALLFDISFLMLCHVVQTYGSEVRLCWQEYELWSFKKGLDEWLIGFFRDPVLSDAISAETIAPVHFSLPTVGDLIRPQSLRRDAFLWNVAPDLYAWRGQDSEPRPPLLQTWAW